MSDEEKEERAICSLLDDYDASEALAWLSPLDDALEAAVPGGEVTQFSTSSDSPASEATATTRCPGHAKLHTCARESRRKQKDPNRARNERRFELIRLRRQAAELESDLDGMRRDDARRWSSHAIVGEAGSSQSSLRITEKEYSHQCSVAVWEELARDQRRKRTKSEAENIRLRLLVSSHVKAVNQLRRILAPKRPRTLRADVIACIKEVSKSVDRGGEMAGASTLTLATTDSSAISFNSSLIFDMLKHNVARARTDMDALFLANGLAATEKTYRSAKVEQDDAHGTTMEVAASKVLPYDLESTRRVAWRHFNDVLSKMPDRMFFEYHDERKNEHLDGVDDMIASSYSYELGNGYVSAKFDQWRVIGQYVEHDRVIIIYCIVSETTEFASKTVSGIRILKRVFIVLRRLTPDARDQDHSRSKTLMQSYYWFQPVQYKATPGLEQTLAAVTDFMFGFIGRRISLNYQMIERELQATGGC